MAIIELTIPKEYAGQRVDAALARLLPEYSRSQLSEWLKTEKINIDQRGCKPKEKIFGGESVILHLPEPESLESSLAEDIPLTIIYEDDDLLVIDKPAGLIVHPGAGNPRHTLVNALLHHAPRLQQLPRAGIIHRLDKDTTGLLVVAKSLIAHTNLIRQMQAREVERHYLALVYGHVISGGNITTFYGRHPRNRIKMAVLKGGKEAITDYWLRKSYFDFTLLEVKLMTGRTHQIRVHMAHIHHPIVGDTLYGGQTRFPAGASEPLREALQQFKRQALHAYFLSFKHPITEEELTFTAPLPHDLKSLLTSLDTNIE